MEANANGSKPDVPSAIPESYAVDFTEEDEKLFAELAKEAQIANLRLERLSNATLDPLYRKRNETLRARMPMLWPVAFFNHAELEHRLSLPDDMDALSYLRNVDIKRDDREPRAYQIDFEFEENPYFSNKTLTKNFKYTGSAKATPPEEVTPEHLEFSPDLHLEAEAFKIDWKDGKSLAKAHPPQVDPEGDFMEQGSFFNLFEEKEDPAGIFDTIVEQIYPDVMDYYLGKGEFSAHFEEEDMEDVTDDEEEDEEDDEEEIDLEAPPKKRRRAGK
ncbi:hypothetical protein DACRYDRAFT_24895 [Dacryopinax primogenitus]|uniref:Nucleosome assembly protein n=1 Tax=Dacryopinax primogenitus (strain DJM 731) TaxID=1858805 RepID=M5FS68_DACPD|nr:uncharacterized protein DACRYDRAFT_24895 [Dacryopinax primogenitus]EJT97994.1 hypothetical protein DACRYDRAFT_24895 [Dacryopinax primogenitus]